HNVCLDKNTTLFNVKINRHSYLAGTLSQHAKIGMFCSIGPNTIIGGLGSHPTNQISTHPAFYSTNNQTGKSFVNETYFIEHSETSIGNDVWIGANALILDGIKIGNGAIIAAGAVVTKSVPDYAIVGGVPAKIIKFRYSEHEINNLNKLQWWLLSDVELEALAPIFRKNNIKELINTIHDMKEYEH
ncbi:CatB-related O-acetyltransferase, partial [Providencia rettgeri]|uniref:CatB-related O-acetyltransferase n=1 Tax=Providencia rettgeri TaxID=587 RepID=UPI001C839154